MFSLILAIVVAAVPAAHATPHAASKPPSKATATPVPTPTATPTYMVRIADVTIGVTEAQLIADRGEPMMFFGSPETSLASYPSTGGSANEVLILRRGYVTAVGFVPRTGGVTHEDITVEGVHLGGPYTDLPADNVDGKLDRDGITYTFKPGSDKKTVALLGAALKDDTIHRLAPLGQLPLLHDGSSAADAVVVRAPNDIITSAFENGFVSGHNYCTKPGKVKVVKQHSMQEDGKTYDLVDTACDNSDKTKTLYFDITSVPATPTPEPSK